MNTLQDTIALIEREYPQSLIDLPSFDFKTMSNHMLAQPKYLFRGECCDYPTTTSTFHRNFTKSPHLFEEENHYLTGIHLKTGLQVNEYSLYHFLRESLFGVSILEESTDTDMDTFIAGIMQHYQFDTALIDLTSDINIAAHFASSGVIGSIGKILIISTTSIENQYFDLTKCPGKRPQIQKSFAMSLPNGLDLKSFDFMRNYEAVWLPFTIPPLLVFLTNNIAHGKAASPLCR